MATNRFTVSFCKRKRNGIPSGVSFVAGQPLGSLSYWPIIALSHHMIVWDAAEQVHPGLQFTDYAILGDDVVICDDEVAKAYMRNIDDIQVKISFHKSLISNIGAAEFAKKLRVRGVRVDLSPVS